MEFSVGCSPVDAAHDATETPSLVVRSVGEALCHLVHSRVESLVVRPRIRAHVVATPQVNGVDHGVDGVVDRGLTAAVDESEVVG